MSLFSEAHLEQQKELHQSFPAYGQSSLVFAPMVSELINANSVTSLIDYGCGLGLLRDNLELNGELAVQNYDPALEQHATRPQPAEMLVCLDVLDVIEDDKIDAVLDDLKALTDKMAFLSINTETANQEGEGGDQRSFKPVEWWLPKIMERFELHYFSRIDHGFVVVLKSVSKQ